MDIWEFIKGQLQLVFYVMHNTYLPFGNQDFSIWDLTVTLSIIATIATYFGFIHDEED